MKNPLAPDYTESVRWFLLGFIATVCAIALLAAIAVVAQQGRENIQDWEASYVEV